MSEHFHHIPVMLKPSVDKLLTNRSGIYVDATFGGAGHSSEILSRLDSNGKLFGFDTDEDALQNEIMDDRFQLIHANFRYLKKYLKYYKIEKVDGILADLGVSSHHLDEYQRGFSFQSDSKLDMRMNSMQELTAEDVLMNYPEERLSYIFESYAEITNAKKISAAWVAGRKNNKVKRCSDFAQWLSPFVYGPRNKFLAKVFQGLRIEVNQELESLKTFLKQAEEVLKSGGRLVVLSYHSLEDRMVKQFLKGDEMMQESIFSTGKSIRKFEILTKNVILADEDEIKINPRSRSVRMRVAQKI